ncbi:DnaJ domain protein [Cystobacter fuscus DSM 2262]|uniref:DnaJ domain protein n=1 Tax=Cystobacter fuscus (strain ATCC 25194 / DSM 2262 / NBRC 100088 / M29) TaxID=1242864 RepID=S9R388_CYSF2|nr:J domain-containing protein [Cystobacter fuscus]EPX63358.1 DnaJ domain protein [Cystobacter fuscus DSM 2262]
MSQPPHNGTGKPPPPPPPDIPSEPGQRPTVKVSTVSLGPRPASPPSGARPSSAGLPVAPSSGTPSGTRPTVGVPPNDPSFRPTARVPTLSAAPASPPPAPAGSVPAAPRPGSTPLSSAAIPAVPITRRPGGTPLSSAAVPVVPASPRPGGTPLSSAAIPVVPASPRPGGTPLSTAAVPVVPPPSPGSGRPVSAVGMVRPPPPPPGALQPPPPPAMPSIAPLVPSVAPVVPAVAPPPAASNPMAELAERCARLDQMDYFEILRVERTASPSDIKKAFYRESRAYHPDRFFQLPDKEVKERVNELYKRVTEAYYVLRDDAKRRQYTADVSGPERAHKLRFTESSESETRAASKRQVEEQIGSNPKGRQFYQTGAADADAGRWASAERNLKMALTYEPANTRYKEKLAEVQKVLLEESRKQGGDSFKIR